MGGFWANFGVPRAQFGGNHYLGMFETIVNELSGTENRGIGTRIKVLTLLVSEIW